MDCNILNKYLSYFTIVSIYKEGTVTHSLSKYVLNNLTLIKSTDTVLLGWKLYYNVYWYWDEDAAADDAENNNNNNNNNNCILLSAFFNWVALKCFTLKTC